MNVCSRTSTRVFVRLLIAFMGLFLLGVLHPMPNTAASNNVDCNVTVDINRIKQIDDIDPALEGQADWYYKLGYSVNGGSTYSYITSDIPIVQGDDDLYLDDSDGKNVLSLTAGYSHDYAIRIRIAVFEEDSFYDDTADISPAYGDGADDEVLWLSGAYLQFTLYVANSANNDLYESGSSSDLSAGSSLTYSGADDGSFGSDDNDALITLVISDDYLDDTAPTTTISLSGTAGDNGWYTGTVSFSLSASDNDLGTGVHNTYYRIDSGSTNHGTSSSVSTEGTHTVYYYSEDYKNTESTKSKTVNIDPRPPGTPSPDDGVNGWSTDDTPDFSWSTVSDATSGLAGYLYRVDSGGWTSLGLTTSVTLSSQSDGTHTFYLNAKDKAGNTASASHQFKIDKTAPNNPATTTSVTPQTGAWTSDNTIDLTWGSGSDSASGVKGYYYIWDNSDATVPSSTDSYTSATTITSPALSDNVKVYLHVRTVDNAGNLGTGAYNIGPFKIDTTPPTNPAATDSSSPGVDSWSGDNSVEVRWAAGSDATSGIKGYYVKWDTASTTIPGSGDLFSSGNDTTSSPLSDGSAWYVHIRSVDNSSNLATGAYHIGPFRIDTTAPANPSATGYADPAINSWTNDSTIEVGWGAGSDALSGVKGYYLVWDHDQATLPGSGDTFQVATSQASSSMSDDSAWYLHIRTVDNASNLGSGAYHVGPFKIDSTPPSNPSKTLASSPDTEVWSSDATVDVGWGAGTDGTSGIKGYYIIWSNDPATVPSTGDTFSALSYSTSASLSDNGAWYIHVRAVDNASNIAAGAYHIGPFRIDCTAPTNPGTTQSAEPGVDSWSNDTTIEVAWDSGSDALSGIQGYYILWDNQKSNLPSTGDILTQKNNVTSASLSDNAAWYLHIRIVDNASNLATGAYHIGPFRIDATPPANPSGTVSSAPSVNTWANDTTVDVCWESGSDATSGMKGYYCLWDRNPSTVPAKEDSFISGRNAQSASLADNASWYCHVRSVDNASNAAFGAYHIGPFRIDSTPPENPSSVSSASPGTDSWSNDTTIEVKWDTGSDASSGIKGYCFKWDNSNSTLPTGKDSFSTGTEATSAPLADNAAWYIHVRILDNAGNLANGAYHIGPFKIDAGAPTNPSATLSSDPEVYAWSNDTTIETTWDTGSDATSGIKGYYLRWDNSPATVPGEGDELSSSHNATSARLLENAAWYLHIRIVDNASNLASGAYHIGPFRVDTSGPANPTKALSTDPEIDLWSNDTTVEAGWNAGTDASSGIKGYLIRWDNNQSTIPTEADTLYSGTAITSIPLSDNTVWYLHIRSVDNASNLAEGACHIGPFRIDATPPTNPSSVSSADPAINTWSNHGTVAIVWEAGFDATSGVDGYYLKWDNNRDTVPTGADAFVSGTNTTSAPLSDNVAWYCHLRTADNRGNLAIGALHIGPFRIDAARPVNPARVESAIPGVNIWSNDSTIEVVWEAGVDGTSGIHGYYIRWDNTKDTLPAEEDSFSAGTGTTSPPLSDNAAWYLHVRSVDNAGNLADGAYHVGPFRIDAAGPVSAALSVGSAFTNVTSIDLSVSGNDSMSGPSEMAFSEDGNAWSPWEMFCATRRIELSPPDGPKTIYLKIRDAAGNEAVSATPCRITLDTAPPESSVAALPQKSDPVMIVSWSGKDITSGIQLYDVQYRQGSTGNWKDWQIGVGNTFGQFTGIAGETYYFRCRARDLCGNVEPYPENPDTDTRLTNGLPDVIISESPISITTGETTDVIVRVSRAGLPLAGASLTVKTDGGTLDLASGITDENGSFTCHFSATEKGTYHLSVSTEKTGYEPVESAITLVVGEKVPPVSVVQPRPGAVLTGTVEMTGTVPDVAARVEIRIGNDDEWHLAFGNGTWTFRWVTTNYENGDCRISIRTMTGGKYSEVVELDVSLANIPVLTILTPPATGKVKGSIDIYGTASFFSTKVLYQIDDGQWKEAGGTSAFWSLRIGLGDIRAGPHAIRVKAVASAGESAVATYKVDVGKEAGPGAQSGGTGPIVAGAIVAAAIVAAAVIIGRRKRVGA